jgi:hypothetical protein
LKQSEKKTKLGISDVFQFGRRLNYEGDSPTHSAKAYNEVREGN